MPLGSIPNAFSRSAFDFFCLLTLLCDHFCDRLDYLDILLFKDYLDLHIKAIYYMYIYSFFFFFPFSGGESIPRNSLFVSSTCCVPLYPNFIQISTNWNSCLHVHMLFGVSQRVWHSFSDKQFYFYLCLHRIGAIGESP